MIAVKVVIVFVLIHIILQLLAENKSWVDQHQMQQEKVKEEKTAKDASSDRPQNEEGLAMTWKEACDYMNLLTHQVQ